MINLNLLQDWPVLMPVAVKYVFAFVPLPPFRRGLGRQAIIRDLSGLVVLF